jgi:hypothetical protein
LVLAKTDPQRAGEVLEEAHELAAERGQRGVAIEALHNRGELERDRGSFTAAQGLMERALSEAREADLVTAPMLHGLGDLALDRDDTAEARRRYVEAFHESVRAQMSMPTILAVAGLAAVFAADGQTQTAGRLWGAAQTLAEQLGHSLGAAASSTEVQRYEAWLPLADEPAFASGLEDGRAKDPLLVVEAALGNLN